MAAEWIAWARAPNHDSYWTFHRERFLDLVPAPGRLTLDVGCGEGRVGRDLTERGHEVVGLDSSPTLVRACVEHRDGHPAIVGDAARLPVADGAVDLVIGFMSYHDFDELEPAIAESRRVLTPGGSIHLAIVHPFNSAGTWTLSSSAHGHPTLAMEEPYLQSHAYSDSTERDGLTMTFHGVHRPLLTYMNLLATNGFRIERVDEVVDPDPASLWSRVPLFLHLIAQAEPAAIDDDPR